MSKAQNSIVSRILNSPTGPKTSHFWAPVMKWTLVLAGFKDLQRPVDKISGTQQFALMATGLIWTRWSMVIIPKNYLLASVNAFLGGVAGLQVARVYNWRRTSGDSPSSAIEYVIGLSENAQRKMKAANDAANARASAQINDK